MNKSKSYYQLLRLAEQFSSSIKIIAAIDLAVPEFDAQIIKNSKQYLIIEQNLFSLIGHNGVLPDHFTEYLLKRINAKDYILKDFLDIFNHGFAMLYYKAWCRSEFFIAYEKKNENLTPQDYSISLLFSLFGLSSKIEYFPLNQAARGVSMQTVKNMDVFYEPPGMDSRRVCIETPRIGLEREFLLETTFFRDVFLYHAGIMAASIKSKAGLQTVLSNFFDLPVSIQEFTGQHLLISMEERTCLSTAKQFNQLGIDTTLGKYVWQAQNSFTVNIGAIDYSEYLTLLPRQKKLTIVKQLIKIFCGMEYNFSINIIINYLTLPSCLLNADKKRCCQLSWNTWLRTARLPNKNVSIIFMKPMKLISRNTNYGA